MRIIICGAGQVGFNIAQTLDTRGNDIVVIDKTASLVASVCETLDVRGVVGHGSRPDVLQSAGADDADMIIAVTPSDEVNMVACQVAHTQFNIPRKIARIRSRGYLDKTEEGGFFDQYSMSINLRISPELAVARNVIRRLRFPGTFDSAEFLAGHAWFIGIMIAQECPVIHTPLRQLTQLFPDLKAVIVACIRDGRIITLSGEDQLFPADQIYCIAPAEQIERTLALFGHTEPPTKRIIVLGGGYTGLEVAMQIEKGKSEMRTKLIELDRERAEVCAERLHRTIVLHGSGLDAGVLREAGVSEADAIVTLSFDDRTNLLAGVLAKELGCRRAIAIVNDSSLARLASPIGIDALIDPRTITVSSILPYLRRGRIRKLYAVQGTDAEMIEAQAMETSPLVRRPLKEIDWPPGVMFGFAYSNEMLYTMADSYTVKPGDLVLLFALKSAIKHVERLLSVDIEFFG